MARGKAVVVTGVGRLDRQLRALEPAIGKKATRKALRAAAKVVQKEAQRIAPKKTGALSRSIKVRARKVRRRRDKGTIGMKATVGKGWFKGDTFYAAFLEFGTKNMRFHPFMRPALYDKADAAKAVFRGILKQELRKALAMVRVKR